MNFSNALDYLNKGYPLVRKSDNDVFCFIYKQVSNIVDKHIVPNMTSLPPAIKLLLDNTELHFQTQFNKVQYRYSFDKVNINSWLPTSDDLTAEDWVVFEDADTLDLIESE